MKRGASGDIFLKLHRAHPPHHSRRRHSHQHDRRLPRRNGRGFRRAVPVRGSRPRSTAWASSPIPTKTPAPAIDLDGKVDGRTIYNRKRRLMAMQRKIARARNRQLVGSEVTVLVEGAFEGDRPAVGRPHVHAGPRDRRRDSDQRFRRRRAQARRNPPPANHRSARLRSGRHAAPGDPRNIRSPCRLFRCSRSCHSPVRQVPIPAL